jgi:hypothetical protein
VQSHVNRPPVDESRFRRGSCDGVSGFAVMVEEVAVEVAGVAAGSTVTSMIG